MDLKGEKELHNCQLMSSHTRMQLGSHTDQKLYSSDLILFDEICSDGDALLLTNIIGINAIYVSIC